MISAIKFNEENLTELQIQNTPFYFTKINNLNAIVGVNNSGKSKLLRTLFGDWDNIKYFTDNPDEKDFNQIVKNFSSELRRIVNDVGLKRGSITIRPSIPSLKELIKLQPSQFRELLEIIITYKEISKKDFIFPHSHSESHLDAIIQRLKGLAKMIEKQVTTFYQPDNTNKIYIPILRGLRPIQLLEENKFSNKDSFLERTKFDYFQKISSYSKIYTGLSIYEDVMKNLLGTEQQRQLIREFELFLSSKIFNGKKITLIPKYKEDVLHIKIGNDPQLEIYNLGDGIQTIISILFPVFINRNKNTLVFIEEPESHLHHDWQYLLIVALKTFEKHTFFFTTHSAAFINDSAISTYFIQKDNIKFIIKNSNLESDKIHIIRNLGYKPSDLFQTNFILWVEGPSDKIYCEYWLSKVDEELLEGIHYSVMFYGGSNYKEFLNDGEKFSLDFVKNLNQNFGIILDSDRKRKNEELPKRKQEIEDLFSGHNNFCWITSYREIENYIPLSTFTNAVISFHQKNRVEIPEGNYENRCLPTDPASPLSFKSTIKLSQKLFSEIQKNGDGSTKNIDGINLRREINQAIKRTATNKFKIAKIGVARKVVELEPDIENEELKNQMNKLATIIRKANLLK